MQNLKFYLLFLSVFVGVSLLKSQTVTIPTPDLAIKFSQDQYQVGTPHFNLLKTHGGLTPQSFTVTDHTLQHTSSNLNFSYDRLNKDNGAVSSVNGADGIYLVSNHIFGEEIDLTQPKTISFWVNVRPQAETENSSGLTNDFMIAFQTSPDFTENRRGLVLDKTQVANRRMYLKKNREGSNTFHYDYSFFAPASLDAGQGWYHIIWVIGSYHQRLYVGKPGDVTYLKMDYKYFGGTYAWLGFEHQYLETAGTKTVLTLAAYDSSIDYFDNLCVWNKELTPEEVRALHECQKKNPIENCFNHEQQSLEDDQPERLTTFKHEAGNYVMVGSYREAYTPDRSRRAFPKQSKDAIFGILFDKDNPCDAVEADIRLSSDNVPYLFSDECLDDLTNTKGSFSSKTAAQINQVQLNPPLGQNASDFGGDLLNITPLSDLKVNIYAADLDNSLEGFDKLFVFTIHATGQQYEDAFTELLLAARYGKWLNKLAIRGDLSKTQLVELLNTINTSHEIAIGLDDFNYIPIATDGPSGVSNTSQNNLKSMIAANDSLNLQFAQTEMQWSNGSLLEVQTSTGQNAFNNVYNLVTQSMVSGMHPAVTYLWRDGNKGILQTGPQCPQTLKYQSTGAPYNYSTNTDPVVDGRVDLDFLVANGARYIKTDNSPAALSHLRNKGLRNQLTDSEEPVIAEVAVPKNFNWGSVSVSGVNGMARKIADLSKVEFGTVDTEISSRKLSVLDNWNRGKDGDNNPWDPAWLAPATQGAVSDRCQCSQQYLKGTGGMASKNPISGFYLRYALPLRALNVWAANYKSRKTVYDLYINANRFDTRDPMSNDASRTAIQKMFYGMPCSAVLGPFYAREDNSMDNKLVQFRPENYPEDPPSAHDDGFIVMSDNSGNESITMTKYGSTDDFVKQNSDNIKLVLGGHILVKDGLITNPMPPGSGSGSNKKRIVVGVTANNEVIIMATFSEHKSVEVAQLMVYHYQCMDVFQFDSGGSVAMFSNTGNNPTPQSEVYIKNGLGPNDFVNVPNGVTKVVQVASPPMDRPPRVDKATNSDDPRFWAYRPIPNFLGIKIK